ncbi:hypothetical protein EJB05_26176, partial [Eragrostis curvula]
MPSDSCHILQERIALFRSNGPSKPVYAVIPPPKKRAGDILNFMSVDKDIDAAIPSEDEGEDTRVPQPDAGADAPTPSPPAGPPPCKKMKKDLRRPSAVHMNTDAREAGSSEGVVVCPILDISSIERAPETNPSEAIPERTMELEEGAVEDLGGGFDDSILEGRPPTPPREASPTKLSTPPAANLPEAEEHNEDANKAEAEVDAGAPETSHEGPEEHILTTDTDNNSAEPEKAAETEENILQPITPPPATNKEERQDTEGESPQQLSKECLEADHRVLEKEAIVASAEAGIIPPITSLESESREPESFSSHTQDSSELQKLLSDWGEDTRRQKEIESINQTTFYHHYGGLLEMEKNLAAKEKMLLDLKPHLDKQLAMEKQIVALQAESREKDAQIQKLQSAAASSSDHERLKSRIRTLEDQYAKASQSLTERDEQLKNCQTALEVAQKQIEGHTTKEEQFYQELSKTVDAETAATKVAREKTQSLTAALEQISNLRTNLLELELSAYEVIDYVYPSVELKDKKSAAELLEMMPAVLKDHCQFVAKMVSGAVFAKAKSHYPGLEESRLLTGYACERPEALALIEEVKGTAIKLVADLNVDP